MARYQFPKQVADNQSEILYLFWNTTDNRYSSIIKRLYITPHHIEAVKDVISIDVYRVIRNSEAGKYIN